MRRALFGGVVLLFLLFAVQLFPRASQAIEPSVWQAPFTISENQIVDPTDRDTAECSYAFMRLRLYLAGTATSPTDVLFNPSKETASTPKDLCAVHGKIGAFSGAQGYWAPTENLDDVLQIENATIIPVPNSSTVLFTSVFGSDPGGFRTSINYNFPAIGRLEAGYTGPSNKRVKFKKWRVTSSASQMQFANNSAMTFKRWSFSENGKFAVASLFSGMLIRVNLQTQEIQPIRQLPANKPNWQLGISNDGKYVVSYEPSSSSLSFHDLSGCQKQYAKGTLPSSGADTAGCITTTLQSTVQALYPTTTLRLMNNFRFGTNGAEFAIDTVWQTTTSELVKRRLTFRAQNYTPQNEGYLAFGDSFSSGEGDLQGGEWYEPGTDEQGNANTFEGRNLCHVSRRSYPYLLAKELGYLTGGLGYPVTPEDSGRFHSVACSGAVIHNVIGSDRGPKDGIGGADDFANRDNQYSNSFLGELGRWQPGRIKQLDRLDPTVFGSYAATETKPAVITLGIGGNDAGFGDVIKACAMPGTCKQAVRGSIDASNLALLIAKLKPKLTETYKSIKRAEPNARIYVHGYPLFVQGYGGTCNTNVLLNEQETALVEEGVRYMNSVVQAAATEAGVFYVDVTDILIGKNLCSGAEQSSISVNGITAGNDMNHPVLGILTNGYCFFRTGCLGSESYHPNPLAHQLYAQALLKQTSNLTLPVPSATKTTYPLPDSFFGQPAIDAIVGLNGGQSFTVVIPEPKPFVQSTEQGLRIVQDGLLPGSILRVEMHSTPITLAEFTVPEDGTVQQLISLPPDAEPGVHELHMFGMTTFGESINYYEPLMIAFSDTDFDGDGVADAEDSCLLIMNSFTDIDQDAIDDACDPEAIAPMDPEEPLIDENPEEAAENQGEEKGQPNPETVAGDESTNPQVLGAATASDDESNVLSVANVLATTGKEVWLSSLVGLGIIVCAVGLVRLQIQEKYRNQ